MVNMRNGVMTGVLDDIDGAAEHIVNMLQTKGAILEYVEPMAQVLAEAGRASAKAMGDPAEYAVREWSRVIMERALEILREGRATGGVDEKRRLGSLSERAPRAE
jgi:hypothetical protein